MHTFQSPPILYDTNNALILHLKPAQKCPPNTAFAQWHKKDENVYENYSDCVSCHTLFRNGKVTADIVS
jgi:hypothetical protein